MSKIWNWLKAAFTWHNAKAVAVTAERGAITGADVARDDFAGAITEAASAADAARSVHVNGFEPSKATATRSAHEITTVELKLPTVTINTVSTENK
jgi:hypothetical protein